MSTKICGRSAIGGPHASQSDVCELLDGHVGPHVGAYRGWVWPCPVPLPDAAGICGNHVSLGFAEDCGGHRRTA